MIGDLDDDLFDAETINRINGIHGSDNEDEEREDLMMHVEMQLNELLDHIISESERIGGGFRGPGIKQEAFTLISDMIGSYKR